MATIRFTIPGNQDNKGGNPIPYARTTQAGQWTDRAIRYRAWKNHVVAQYIDAVRLLGPDDRALFGTEKDLTDKKPIPKTKGKVYMHLMITYCNKAHGDSDNLFKGIADALFMDDKYIAGSFDYEYGKEGKVEVEIIIT